MAGLVGPIGTSTGDGYINLNVRTESGSVLSQLFINSSPVTPQDGRDLAMLTSLNVSTQPYYWGQTNSIDAAASLGYTVPATSTFMWKTDARLMASHSTHRYLHYLGRFTA